MSVANTHGGSDDGEWQGLLSRASQAGYGTATAGTSGRLNARGSWKDSRNVRKLLLGGLWPKMGETMVGSFRARPGNAQNTEPYRISED